jgi:hypothetical protein
LIFINFILVIFNFLIKGIETKTFFQLNFRFRRGRAAAAANGRRANGRAGARGMVKKWKVV